MAQYETKFSSTTLPATLSLGSTRWQRFASAYYDFVEGGGDPQRLYEMQITDSSSDILYRQRIGSGAEAATAFTVQAAGMTAESSTMVQYNSFAPVNYTINTANFVSAPSRLLIPPGSFLKVTTVNAITVPADTVAIRLVTEDA